MNIEKYFFHLFNPKKKFFDQILIFEQDEK